MGYKEDKKIEMELRLLSREELIKVSLRKNKKGLGTHEAYIAQEIMWDDAGKPYTHPYINVNYNIDVGDDVYMPEYYESKMHKVVGRSK